jgi:predicted nucleic acid-binding protein
VSAAVFVDTSAWYILCDRRDARHSRAAGILGDRTRHFVTSNFVFVESLSLITKRLGKGAAIRFGKDLRASDRVRIIHIDARMEESAWSLFEDYADKDWDLVDCSSFILMQSLKLTKAFTFDSHFAQRGLEIVP